MFEPLDPRLQEAVKRAAEDPNQMTVDEVIEQIEHEKDRCGNVATRDQVVREIVRKRLAEKEK